MKHNLGLIAIIFLIGITLASLIIVYPGIFRIQPNSIISVSQLYVDPQGSVDGSGNVVNSYWNLLFNVEGINVVQGVQLPAGTTGQTMIDGISKAVSTRTGVEVDITPQQAYLIRDVQVQQVTVAPGGHGNTGSDSSPLTLQYYNWLEPSFRIYTPYHVAVYKNGVQIGSADLGGQLNHDGTPVSPQQTIPTSDGNVIIQNLGGLLGTYMDPSMPSQIAILLGQPFIYDWAQVQNMIDGTQAGSAAGTSATKYCDYWFGNVRNTNNQAINPTFVVGGQVTSQFAGLPGWEGTASTFSAVKPVIYSGDKSGLPSDKRNAMSMTEWIQSKGVANLASGGSSVLSKYASYALVMDNGGSALKINIPWGGYSTPLVTMRVPTSMADTWVELPQVSDVGVSAHWQANNLKTIDMTDQAVLAVDLLQKSTATSSARISVSSNNARVSVYPIQTVETLASGATKTVLFTVSQTGGTTRVDNVQITINSYETYTGTLKESDTVTANLLPTVGVDSTTLNLLVQDDSKAHTPIEGLQVMVQYPASTGTIKTAITDNNGAATLDLATSAGGGYVGSITITTEDTTKYDIAYVTTTVHAGQNNVVVNVHIKGTVTPTNWILIAEIAGIVVAVIVIVSLGYVTMKKSKHRRLKR